MTNRNNAFLIIACVMMVGLAMPAFGQTETQNFLNEIQNKTQDELQLDDPFEETEMEDYPFVRLRSLDKITARTLTFEAQVGSTITFGNIFIKVQACRQATPVDEPESAAFLQIWEGADEWIFSGWMFASSPGLSHMDHPVYDVWVLDCLLEKTPDATKQEEGEEQAKEGEGELKENEAPAAPQESEKLEQPASEENAPQ